MLWPPPNQSATVFVGPTFAQTGVRLQCFKAKTEFGYGLVSTDFSLTSYFSWVLTTLERAATAKAVVVADLAIPLSEAVLMK